MAANDAFFSEETLDYIKFIVKRFVALGFHKNDTTLAYQKVVQIVKNNDLTDISEIARDANTTGQELLRSIDFGFDLEYDSNGDIVIPADLSDEFVEANLPRGGKNLSGTSLFRFETVDQEKIKSPSSSTSGGCDSNVDHHSLQNVSPAIFSPTERYAKDIITIKEYFNERMGDPTADVVQIIKYKTFAEDLLRERRVLIHSIALAYGLHSGRELLESFGIRINPDGFIIPDTIKITPSGKNTLRTVNQNIQISTKVKSEIRDNDGDHAKAAILQPPPKRPRIASDGHASNVCEDLFENDDQNYSYAGNVNDLKWGMKVKAGEKEFILPTFPVFFNPSEENLNAQREAVDQFNQTVNEIVVEFNGRMDINVDDDERGNN